MLAKRTIRNKFPASSDFLLAVYRVVSRIPRGKTLSYGEVARLSGYPNAARAVGNAMKRNRSDRVPCHRVIHSNGRIGGYAFGGTGKKEERLRKEGVRMRGRGRVFQKTSNSGTLEPL